MDNANKITSCNENQILIDQLETRRQWLQQVRNVFQSVDSDESGYVSRDEFRSLLGDWKVTALLSKLGLDVQRQQEDSLFNLFDFDGGGYIDLEEFVLSLESLSGNARSIDLAKLRYQVKRMEETILSTCGDQARENHVGRASGVMCGGRPGGFRTTLFGRGL